MDCCHQMDDLNPGEMPSKESIAVTIFPITDVTDMTAHDVDLDSCVPNGEYKGSNQIRKVLNTFKFQFYCLNKASVSIVVQVSLLTGAL